MVLGRGQIMADGTPAQVFAQADVLRETFLEPPQITQLAQRARNLGFDPGTLTVSHMLEQYRRLAGEPAD